MSLFPGVTVTYQKVDFKVEVDQVVPPKPANLNTHPGEPPEAGDFNIIRIAFASDDKIRRIDRMVNGFRKTLFVKPEADRTLDQRQTEFLILDDHFNQFVYEALF